MTNGTDWNWFCKQVLKYKKTGKKKIISFIEYVILYKVDRILTQN